jgi:hypothetical protein
MHSRRGGFQSSRVFTSLHHKHATPLRLISEPEYIYMTFQAVAFRSLAQPSPLPGPQLFPSSAKRALPGDNILPIARSCYLDCHSYCFYSCQPLKIYAALLYVVPVPVPSALSGGFVIRYHTHRCSMPLCLALTAPKPPAPTNWSSPPHLHRHSLLAFAETAVRQRSDIECRISNIGRDSLGPVTSPRHISISHLL